MKNRWSEEDINYLKLNYPGKGTENCPELLKRYSKHQISERARKLDLKVYRNWNPDDLSLLEYHWGNSDMETLLSTFPGFTYKELMGQAGYRKFKTLGQRNRKGDIKFLDELNPLSLYWWGFIMADGHITLNGELTISISNKDKSHLEKLSNIVGIDVKDLPKNMCNFNISDKILFNKWFKIFNMDGKPKTYNPPNLDIFLTKENLIYFIIGFIDGDGCVWNNKGFNSLRVEIHGSWFKTLELINSKLKEFYNINGKVSMNKKGYSKLDINGVRINKFLKYINDVPFLERKWVKLKEFDI